MTEEKETERCMVTSHERIEVGRTGWLAHSLFCSVSSASIVILSVETNEVAHCSLVGRPAGASFEDNAEPESACHRLGKPEDISQQSSQLQVYSWPTTPTVTGDIHRTLLLPTVAAAVVTRCVRRWCSAPIANKGFFASLANFCAKCVTMFCR